MTGILPIKKYGKHSALNMFTEYSMMFPRQMTRFTGFTEEEVRNLCSRYGRDYQAVSDWYDGYEVSDIIPPDPDYEELRATGKSPEAVRYSLYSPLSVVEATTTGIIKDYYALPDDRRVELIDGWIYDMAAPSRIHQTVLIQLAAQFVSCLKEHPEILLQIAPSDVRLDNDRWTMVQPDLFIVCNSQDNDPQRTNGAPDFIIEILSPSNRYHDMFRKLNKYRLAHVREYWIIDPEKQRITVYDFEHDELPMTYTFGDTVPIGISKGECEVDFSEIYDKVKKYL